MQIYVYSISLINQFIFSDMIFWPLTIQFIMKDFGGFVRVHVPLICIFLPQ